MYAVLENVIARYTVLLVFLSLILVLHPVLPFIEYYTFKKYIAENLCINRDNPMSCCEGKCYLEKRIKENNEEQSQDKEKPVIPQLKRIEYNLPEKPGFLFFEEEMRNEFDYLGSFYFPDFYKTIFHPPRFLCV